MKLLITISYLTFLSQFCYCEIHKGGILFPKASETRELLSLDGLWNFHAPNVSSTLTDSDAPRYRNGLSELNELEVMPVPASYNDLSTSSKIRDYVGVVWYERTFFAPKSWASAGKVWLRLGSVNYAAEVYINGNLTLAHEIGQLPFHGEITDLLQYGKENRITIACDNTPRNDTIPQGSTTTDAAGIKRLSYTYDFFDYAGIHRPVTLYTTPEVYIDDVDIKTTISDDLSSATVDYDITILGDGDVDCKITLLDKDNKVVGDGDGSAGTISVENPQLWWPYLMNADPGYQYNLQIELLDGTNLVDKYSQKFGIRSLFWNNDTWTINGQKIYFAGFGRHEDSDFRGKGLDLPLVIRDHNLIKWIGANGYRTSHYPYAEEIMDLADDLGIMIIDECPAVNVEGFIDSQLANHKQSLTELYKRDKNRPSVVLWSVANEPRTTHEESKEYFKQVIEHIKGLDNTRPVTVVEMSTPDTTHGSDFVDIYSQNRYNAWYSDAGDLDIIKTKLKDEIHKARELYNKPVLMTEYGADTLEGLRILPTYIWSEEYQNDLMSKHFEAFDELRSEGFFVGELIWNFADFKTGQEIRRVGGNKKGIFTRNRQPKSSAYLLRRRYWALAKQHNKDLVLPDDLDNYVIQHDEL